MIAIQLSKEIENTLLSGNVLCLEEENYYQFPDFLYKKENNKWYILEKEDYNKELLSFKNANKNELI